MTRAKFAEKYGVSERSVKRDALFSRNVDAIGDASPEAKSEILAGEVGLTRAQISTLADVAKTTPERIVSQFNEIVSEVKEKGERERVERAEMKPVYDEMQRLADRAGVSHASEAELQRRTYGVIAAAERISGLESPEVVWSIFPKFAYDALPTIKAASEWLAAFVKESEA